MYTRQVLIETFANLTVRIAGGTDGQGGGSGPVVVLLHGFGAPGDDLVSLWRVLRAPRGTRFVLPEAPLQLPAEYGNGRAWWWIDMEARMRRRQQGIAPDVGEVPEGLREARASVETLLAEVSRALGPPVNQVVLGGFSQGAMLSLDVALHSDRPLAGLVFMSGTHIAAEEWAARYDERRGLPVFMSHGEQDELLSFGVAQRLRQTLASHGFLVDWLPFPGGHAIPWDVIEGAGAFLSRVLG
jgi:phospholipase/carboxylesterase